MLDFMIFAITFVVIMISFVIYLYPARSQSCSIPGIPQSDPKDGNLAEISSAGSINDFLVSLHEEYGPIASFWIGSQMAVSLASPEYFEEHKHAFDRPSELYDMYKPLFGESSTMFCNGQTARIRRKLLIQSFEMLSESGCDDALQKSCEELGTKWASLGFEEHVPLWTYMKAFCLKCSSNILLGSGMLTDDNQVLFFTRNLEQCFSALELQTNEAVADLRNSQKRHFKEVLDNIYDILFNYIQNCRSKKTKNESSFIKNFVSSDLSNVVIVDDMITCLFYYYSISSLLCWALYFISTNPEVQEKIFTEIEKGRKESFNYLRKVMKETLRLVPIFPWTARKQADIDTVIGGHIIPKNTIIIHAIGIVMSSEQYWTLPKTFNPDRFDEDSMNNLIYAPFGFAGNRKCPAEEFVVEKFTRFLYEICQKFILKPVDDQRVDPLCSSIVKPAEEIWITLEKRSNI